MSSSYLYYFEADVCQYTSHRITSLGAFCTIYLMKIFAGIIKSQLPQKSYKVVKSCCDWGWMWKTRDLCGLYKAWGSNTCALVSASGPLGRAFDFKHYLAREWGEGFPCCDSDCCLGVCLTRVLIACLASYINAFLFLTKNQFPLRWNSFGQQVLWPEPRCHFLYIRELMRHF